MRLGKYLSSLTKPELEELRDRLALNDSEKEIISMLRNEKSIIEISNELCVSIPTTNRKIKQIKYKLERDDYMKNTIPVWEKINLTIEEAAEYSNIGINKINELAKNPMCPFVLYVGRKKLIKRKEFEKFIATTLEL